MMNQLYFSIESRKGGVGKTTIALNMCKMLRKKGYVVLMLDCDITGTSSSETSENSEFWKDEINEEYSHDELAFERSYPDLVARVVSTEEVSK